jgi:ankyrin repeat protein
MDLVTISSGLARGPLATRGDVMADLPARPDLDQLRRQAKDLLGDARQGDPAALARVRAVSDRPTLAAAQLALAREHGFASWARLKAEVTRRAILDGRDLARLAALLAEDPAQATAKLEHWRDHPKGASPLGYVAMLRYDTARGLWRDVAGTGPLARALLEAGAPVDGDPGDPETPLITAASYGDAAVARVLIEAGADLEATAAADAGGVPGATALGHAAVFGMTEVLDVLVAAGARVHGIEEAAAAGDLDGWLEDRTPPDARVRALVMAADHQRLEVIDRLVAAGTPVDAVDPVWGRHPLRLAAANGRPAGVRRLLAHGADPDLRDAEHRRTPLAWCRHQRQAGGGAGHDEVEAILAPLTRPG